MLFRSLADTAETPLIVSVDGASSGTHDPNELPYIARHTALRHDSFYNNSNDVNDIVMAFDIDRTKYDNQMCVWDPKFVCWFLIIMITFLLFGVVHSMVFAYFWYLVHYFHRRSKQLKVKRLHVALTRNDIYFDLADKPDSHNLMIRQIFPFNQIQDCVVEAESNCWDDTINYKVALQFKEKKWIVDGIASPQRFVDVVNDMIKKWSELTIEEESLKALV